VLWLKIIKIKMEIRVCPKCESKYIRIVKRGYICDSCNRIFSEKTSRYRELLDNDYIILNDKTKKEVKEQVFNLIFNKLKMKILNRKNTDDNLKKWLNIYYIKYVMGEKITVENLYKYLKGIEGICEICGNKLDFIGAWKRNGGYNKYCSEECLFKSRSIYQKNNNSVYKIKDKKAWTKKLSNTMKEKIRKGEFVPNITNSWANSKCVCEINNKQIKFRSSWEAFFNIVNPYLLYEKVIIPYKYKNEEHNYIVDFVDNNQKKLYEIKPDSEKDKKRNQAKRKFALNWCKQNEYSYITIGDEWFRSNFKKYKHLLIGQIDSENLLKKLRQFE